MKGKTFFNKKKHKSDSQITKESILKLQNRVIDLEQSAILFQNELSRLQLRDNPKGLIIPVSIFNQKGLTLLECLCKYLKEEKNLTFHKIAVALNRDDRTIWTTYNRTKIKHPSSLDISYSEFYIPLSIFSNRNRIFSNLLIAYLKETYQLTFTQIAKIIARDPRNVWRCYHLK